MFKPIHKVKIITQALSFSTSSGLKMFKMKALALCCYDFNFVFCLISVWYGKQDGEFFAFSDILDLPLHVGKRYRYHTCNYLYYCIELKKSSKVWIIIGNFCLFIYLLFYVSLKNFPLVWRHQNYRWRAAEFRPIFITQGLWVGRDLYRATPAVTRDLGFSGLI
jgi:hypothetical protein